MAAFNTFRVTLLAFQQAIDERRQEWRDLLARHRREFDHVTSLGLATGSLNGRWEDVDNRINAYNVRNAETFQFWGTGYHQLNVPSLAQPIRQTGTETANSLVQRAIQTCAHNLQESEEEATRQENLNTGNIDWTARMCRKILNKLDRMERRERKIQRHSLADGDEPCLYDGDCVEMELLVNMLKLMMETYAGIYLARQTLLMEYFERIDQALPSEDDEDEDGRSYHQALYRPRGCDEYSFCEDCSQFGIGKGDENSTECGCHDSHGSIILPQSKITDYFASPKGIVSTTTPMRRELKDGAPYPQSESQ